MQWLGFDAYLCQSRALRHPRRPSHHQILRLASTFRFLLDRLGMPVVEPPSRTESLSSSGSMIGFLRLPSRLTSVYNSPSSALGAVLASHGRNPSHSLFIPVHNATLAIDNLDQDEITKRT
jgi:hypothetical protein